MMRRSVKRVAHIRRPAHAAAREFVVDVGACGIDRRVRRAHPISQRFDVGQLFKDDLPRLGPKGFQTGKVERVFQRRRVVAAHLFDKIRAERSLDAVPVQRLCRGRHVFRRGELVINSIDDVRRDADFFAVIVGDFAAGKFLNFPKMRDDVLRAGGGRACSRQTSWRSR